MLPLGAIKANANAKSAVPLIITSSNSVPLLVSWCVSEKTEKLLDRFHPNCIIAQPTTD